MMVLGDLNDQIPLWEISRISGISLSGCYYKPRKRHVQRLDFSTMERIKDITSERPTYGYREYGQYWGSRYKGEPEDRQEGHEGQKSLPSCIKAQK